MSLKKIDSRSYDACRECEDYFGSRAMMEAVLEQHPKRDFIDLDVADGRIVPVSPTRLRQYLYERREDEQRKALVRDRVIVAGVTWVGAIIGACIATLIGT